MAPAVPSLKESRGVQMGLTDFLKKQLIDIIQWTEAGDDVLAWRFPTADFEIQQGAQLIVRDTQMALFVHEGQAADLFRPGRHAIRTENLPLLTDLRHWARGFESPFKSEVYFFSTRLRLERTWGTAQPVTLRDAEFGAVRLRAYGVYSYRIADPRTFFTRVSGTRDSYVAADVEGQLRSSLVTTLTDHFGDAGVPFLDMAARLADLGTAVRDRARPLFAALGLALESVFLENVSLPAELQQRLDERIGMGIVGDLQRYTQFQTARSIGVAAEREGGTAAAGVGLGAGLAMGQVMAQTVAGATAPARPTAAAPPAPATSAGNAPPATQALRCPHCQATLERAPRFCPECGTAIG
jgi:membrane protease subunit (stomatin/prohibitin family)